MIVAHLHQKENEKPTYKNGFVKRPFKHDKAGFIVSEGENKTQPSACEGDFGIHCFRKENLSLNPSQPLVTERPFAHEKIKSYASEGAHFYTHAELLQRIIVIDRDRGTISGPSPFNYGAALQTNLIFVLQDKILIVKSFLSHKVGCF